MDPQTISSTNRRVIRVVEYYNNLCEKESRSPESDAQLPSLRLKISRIRELIVILSLYEDKIKYLSVDSNRIIPCVIDNRERIKFTDCKIQLVVQIRRQNFWRKTARSSVQIVPRILQTPNLNNSSAPQHLQQQSSNETRFPTINVDFRLSDSYPESHTSDSLNVQISKVVHFSAIKHAALEELLLRQLEQESRPEIVYNIIWSVTYFLHILDSFDDNDALLHSSNSADLISQLVAVHPRHLTSPALLDSFLHAQQQVATDIKRKRKLAHSQLDHFHPDPALLDLRAQTFAVLPGDLVPSVLDQKSADNLFYKLTSFHFHDKHAENIRKITLRLEKEVTHCFYIKKLCFVRHRQEYSAFEATSGFSYRFVRIAFELKPLITEASELPEVLEKICRTSLGDDTIAKLDEVLKLELSRGCQFIESVYFGFEFIENRIEFSLVCEAFPPGSDEYCSLEALSKTTGFHETGLLPDLRYGFLERILIGFGHLHKAQFAHGSFEPKKMFVSSSGAMKIYDVFLDAAAMQLIPFAIDANDLSLQKVQRLTVQSFIRDDCFNVGALVLALWSDCNFEPISAFQPGTTLNAYIQRTEERLTKLNGSNVAHFAKECFKIYYRQSELQLQSLLSHAFVLEWQMKNILNAKKRTKIDQNIVDSTCSKVQVENGEEKIPSWYDRSQKEFFPVMSLGKGAFGNVFMVRNNIDGTEYALKCVHLRDTTTARNNLLREVNHLARLVHPNVVRYYASWFEYDSGDWNYLQPIDDGHELDLDEYDSDYDYDEDDDDQTEDSRPKTFDEVEESDNGGGDSLVEFVHDSADNSAFLKDITEESSCDWKLDKKKPARRTEKSEQEKRGLRLMLCIQMELCDPCTLHDKIREGALLEDSLTRYRILKEVISALAYIHSLDIIHRDLKPSNIFFVNKRVKIGDFGLARRSKQDPNGSPNDGGGVFRKVSTTAFGSCKRVKKMSINFSSSANTLRIGTAQYMAPEVMSDAHYNQKIDLFSLGVIFFEMFYPMATMSERAHYLMSIRPKKNKPSLFPDDMDKYFRPVEIVNLQKLLSINPSERPTAVDLLNSSIFVREDSIHQIESQQKQPEKVNSQESTYLSISHLSFIVNRLLENTSSPQFTFVVRRLMNRPMPLLLSISYDYETDRSLQPNEQLKKTVNFNQIKLHFENVSLSFGALMLESVSTLLPNSCLLEDAVKICDENGVLCDLPYDRRLLISRYLAFNAQNLDFLICSNFSPIFRKAFHGPFHPRQLWTASFDQIWSQAWSEHCILPYCELLTLSTRVLGPILHRGQLIYHLTSLNLLKEICNHLKVSEQLWSALIRLLRDNGERVLGQSVDDLKLAFQLIFESAGVHERVHKFLFSLLRISTISPGELLKNIQSKCQEFDVPEFQKLIQNLTSAVHELERIVNLYRISSAVYMDEQVETRISFRFGLALLTKTAIEYEDLAIHLVYEDLQCERRTLLAIGGRFERTIEAQENLLQQVMPGDLQEALNCESNTINIEVGGSDSTNEESNDNAKRKSQNSVALTLTSDFSKNNNPSVEKILPFRMPRKKRIALGLTFSIDKLSKLEWSTDHLKKLRKHKKNDEIYLTDVVIVTTMPTIDTCKIVQDLRTYGLRVQTLSEMFSLSDKEKFCELFLTNRRKADEGVTRNAKISLVNSTTINNEFMSTQIGNGKLNFGCLENMMRYVINCRVHFVLLIDAFRKPDSDIVDLNTHYSVIENAQSGLSLFRFLDNSSKACRFIRGDLAVPPTKLTDRQAQRSALRLLFRNRKLKLAEEVSLHLHDNSQSEENVLPLEMIRNADFFKKRQSKDSGSGNFEIARSEICYEKSDDKTLHVRKRSQTKKSLKKEELKELFTVKKERIKEYRKQAQRTISETQIRRSRSGSTVSIDCQTPEMIDVGFVTGGKIDRQQITSQVIEFISSRLHFLLNTEEKLKVLVTNLIPFSLLRTFADAATACFSDYEFTSISQDHENHLWRSYFSCLSDLKTRNRTNSDVLEKIGQKLWGWIEEKADCTKLIHNDYCEESHCLVVLMHVGEKPFRYRLVQLDFY